MAGIEFVFNGLSGNTLSVSEPISFELKRNIDAACDGLSVRFLCEDTPFEFDTVTMYSDGDKVFFGICDTQHYNANEKGCSVFVYARSSAAILVDNEALPITYNSPSASTLFHSEAERFGFTNGLPEVYTNHRYTVGKGTSCYGAINNLVKTICGKSVLVNPDNTIYVPSGKGKISLGRKMIISEAKHINRAAPYAEIDYKVIGDEAYIRHCKSRFIEGAGIMRKRKVSVSSLPQWQRDFVLSHTLKKAAEDYHTAKFTIDGAHFFELYDLLEYKNSRLGDYDGYRLHKLSVTQNEKGVFTKLLFKKEFDLKEINYVAE